jgi:hypothetical protein
MELYITEHGNGWIIISDDDDFINDDEICILFELTYEEYKQFIFTCGGYIQWDIDHSGCEDLTFPTKELVETVLKILEPRFILYKLLQ